MHYPSRRLSGLGTAGDDGDVRRVLVTGVEMDGSNGCV